jgi:hypothetical protein
MRLSGSDQNRLHLYKKPRSALIFSGVANIKAIAPQKSPQTQNIESIPRDIDTV